ncbi:MAG: activase, partial [Desulfobacteraceae bacterium]
MGDMQQAIGLCLGASTVSAVCVAQADHQEPNQEPRPRIVAHHVYPHDGSPHAVLQNVITDLEQSGIGKIAVTGRKFRHMLNLSSISEPEAAEYAFRYVKPADKTCPALISAGGETFMVYVLNAKGSITNVITGNKCASGTGEFFLQQLRRMDVDIVQASAWAAETPPYPVSGR